MGRGPELLAALALAASLARGLSRSEAPADEPLRGDHLVHGVAVRVASEASGDAVDVRTAEGRVARLRLVGFGRVALGDHLDAWIHASPITRYANPGPALRWPGPIDAPESRARPIAPDAIRVVAHGRSLVAWLARLVGPLRGAMRDAQRATLAPPAQRLARGMVLGDGHALSDTERSTLARAGLAHLVAVSGLNVVLVVGVLVWLLRNCLRRVEWLAARCDVRRIAAAATIPLAAGFTALTGFQPSAIRAAVMAAIAGILVSLGRHPRTSTILATTLLAALLLDPDAALGPGLLLSVLATAALLRGQDRRVQPLEITPLSDEQFQSSSNALISGRFARRFSELARRGATLVVDRVRALAVTNLRATLATAPIVLWLFGELPPIGLLANLVAVPATSIVLLPVMLVHAVVSLVCTRAASLLAPIVDWGAGLFLSFAELVATAPPITIAPMTFGQWLAAIVTALALLAPAPLASWRRRLAVLGCALALAAAEEARLRPWPAIRGGPLDAPLRVTFLDVGQGDSAYVELPDGRNLLVDAGDAYAGERAVVPYLQSRRIDSLDFLVVTHPHPDHFGGVEAVARALAVRELWDTGQSDVEEPGGDWPRAMRRLSLRGIRIRRPRELCRRTPVPELRVLAPCPDRDPGDDPNDASFVLHLRHGARAILLTGDIEARAERRLVRDARDALRADVLKVPHHGSRTSSASAFLAAVGPSIAVASAGRGNRYEHPHGPVATRFAARSIPLLTTRRCGGVIVETDGQSLDVHPTLPCR
ncbi:MAG: DNA internalization-related competence protein ComEC/Rec2 [Deltaproteobacteria bacterium]|nr:DNA internalization-related competence protein ComEC/Rec2 [Deltaproteobacteria bacterium]